MMTEKSSAHGRLWEEEELYYGNPQQEKPEEHMVGELCKKNVDKVVLGEILASTV